MVARIHIIINVEGLQGLRSKRRKQRKTRRFGASPFRRNYGPPVGLSKVGPHLPFLSTRTDRQVLLPLFHPSYSVPINHAIQSSIHLSIYSAIRNHNYNSPLRFDKKASILHRLDLKQSSHSQLSNLRYCLQCDIRPANEIDILPVRLTGQVQTVPRISTRHVPLQMPCTSMCHEPCAMTYLFGLVPNDLFLHLTETHSARFLP